jgi:hypothetical protein
MHRWGPVADCFGHGYAKSVSMKDRELFDYLSDELLYISSVWSCSATQICRCCVTRVHKLHLKHAGNSFSTSQWIFLWMSLATLQVPLFWALFIICLKSLKALKITESWKSNLPYFIDKKGVGRHLFYWIRYSALQNRCPTE